MILIYINQISTADTLIKESVVFASKLEKQVSVLYASKKVMGAADAENQIIIKLEELKVDVDHVFVETVNQFILAEFCEEEEVSFLFIQLTDNKSKTIRKYLNACRQLRIPYVLFKDSFSEFNLSQVLVPVSFLEEEVEKAQFAAALGRFCKSEILIFQANDYGSKAAINTARITELLYKFNLKHTVQKATNDSFSIDKESVKLAEKSGYGLILLTASRENGLDDMIFGAKELHRVRASSIAIMLINPRADLYALCD